MRYRNGTYAAFYVAEPFNEYNLGAYSAPDFVYYQTLRAWKGADSSFPFIDSHEKTYNVRDGSSWEYTLKPRLHERLRNSKNIVLFLSSRTKASKALSEEMEYGIGILGLPVIVVYPEFDPVLGDGRLDSRAFDLWNKVPAFKRLMDTIPTVHIAMKKDQIRQALNSSFYKVQTKAEPGRYRL